MNTKEQKYYDAAAPNPEDDETVYGDGYTYKDKNKNLRSLSPSRSCFSKCCDPKDENKRQWMLGAGDNKQVSAKSHTSISDFSVKYMASPPKKRWTVSYDNRNYIKSQLSEVVMDHLLEKKKQDNAAVNRIWKRKE
ncbi:hypothetical protein AVEN_211455-1 [Araneus ventricosus]|uniref:Uncharacterized protein n=1 Tax=Araneus ventricosus TaxID=182803 RepID=A0A4Y2J1F6_ARAVE|nr:hypothetical protein AVEN_211455-1 [Araneus ventricosus]